MSQLEIHPDATKVVTLPQTRRVNWTPVALEYAHQLVLSCWVGAAIALEVLVLPGLLGSMRDVGDATWAGLDLLMQFNFVAGGAGAFLLLTSLLMYLLILRSGRATVVQMVLLGLMTVASLTHHLGVGPKMAELLRSRPELLDYVASAELAHFHKLRQIGMVLMASQIVLGSALLFLGVRRWYRYIAPAKASRQLRLVRSGERT